MLQDEDQKIGKWDIYGHSSIILDHLTNNYVKVFYEPNDEDKEKKRIATITSHNNSLSIETSEVHITINTLTNSLDIYSTEELLTHMISSSRKLKGFFALLIIILVIAIYFFRGSFKF